MTTTSIKYYPDKGILFNNTYLKWGMERETVRRLLNGNHRKNDSIIDLSQYNDGSAVSTIIQKRDIFENYKGQDNYFFLNYDEEDLLKEVEIHNGFQIMVDDIKLSFHNDISEIILNLQSISSDMKQLSAGQYLFKDLKMTIADAESMGGDGNTLAYFYCSKNIEHLTGE